MTDWPEDTLPSMALWLARHMGQIRRHEAAADIVAEVTAAVRAATRAIDRPAQRVYAGPCPVCATDLLTQPGRPQVTCTGCGTIHDIQERQDAMRTQLDDYLGTAVYAAAILPGIGIHVSEGTIRVWASRHRLEVRSVVPAKYGGQDQPLYRLGDIVDLALERDVRAGLCACCACARADCCAKIRLTRKSRAPDSPGAFACSPQRRCPASRLSNGRNPHAMHRIRTALAGFAGLAAAVAIAAPAAASPPPSPPRLATAACQVTTPGCNEPVVAIAQTSGNDFVPADDAALTAQRNGTVFTRANNSLDNGTQDWQFVRVDRVPFFFGSGSYGFTAFDRSHYGGDFVYQLEWTPFGQDSGLCLNVNFLNHGVLSGCDGRKGEAFIVTRHVPALNPPAAPNYVFAVNVRHARTLARHLLLTADDSGFGQVFDARAINHSPGVATQQMWSTLP